MSDWDDDDYSHSAPLNERRSPPSSRSYKNRRDDGNRYQRGRNSDDRRGNGRPNYEFKDTTDVRSDCIGLIIGKGGSNIQRLQSEFSVRVDLDKVGGNVTVQGDNERDVQRTLDKIKEQIKNAERGRGGHSDRNSGNSRYNRDNDFCSGSSKGNNDFYSRGSKDNNDFYRGGPKDNNDFYSGSSKDNVDCNSIANNDTNEETGGLIDWASLYKKSEEVRKVKWAKCPPLTKNFYKETAEVAKLTPQQVTRMRLENNDISVSRVFVSEDGAPEEIPNPVWKFEQCFADYPDLLQEINNQGFEKPSPIQSQAWPILLKGEDMIGIAQTGTGKTLAFLLPAMIHTDGQSTPRSQRGGPNVLVLAPTRELALQIEKEVKKYKFRGMKAVCVYGGGNRKEQIGCVERGVEIIICTPGRLNDLVAAKVIDLSSVTYLVLDEADRMLDMGFEPQIRKILLDIRPDRQTVMTSATWPAGVRRLAQSYMSNPVQVCVGSLDLAATHTVTQIVEIMEEDDKYYRMKDFVTRMKPDDKIIIFCSKKARADDLSTELHIDLRIETQCIHGNRDQADREQAIADITSGEVRILIATDVASRGLDIEDITHVINYDFPRNIEEYVHRVGRTGRAGRTGTSISFITPDNWAQTPELIKILEEANQEIPNELRKMAERFARNKEKRKAETGRYNGKRGGHHSGGERNWW